TTVDLEPHVGTKPAQPTLVSTMVARPHERAVRKARGDLVCPWLRLAFPKRESTALSRRNPWSSAGGPEGVTRTSRRCRTFEAASGDPTTARRRATKQVAATRRTSTSSPHLPFLIRSACQVGFAFVVPSSFFTVTRNRLVVRARAGVRGWE